MEASKSTTLDTVQATQFVLPGQRVTEALEEGSVKIGAGLRKEGDEVVATTAGLLCSKIPRRYWVDSHSKRYMAAVNDTVIGVILEKGMESYRVHIGGSCAANLSAIAFDGATKRNKPNLSPGTLIFARVDACDRDLEPELSCKVTSATDGGGVNAGVVKDWVTGQGMFGELKGGNVVPVSMKYARKLLTPTCAVFAALSASLPFEVAVGLNGCVWVNSGSIAHTILITNAIQHSEHCYDDDSAVHRLVRGMLERAA